MAEETKTPETAQSETPPPTKTYTAEEYQALESRVTSLIAQLDEAGKTIQSYKDMDIEGIRQSAEEYKQKAEQAEADRRAFEHRTRISQYVRGLRLRDDVYEQYVTNLLLEKDLQFDGDKLIGGDDVVQAFRESHADAFAPNPQERVSAPTSGSVPTAMSGVEAAFYDMNPTLRK